MWIFKYLACLVHNHYFVDVNCEDLHRRYCYQLCLRCGKVEAQEAVKESILVGGGERLWERTENRHP